MRGRTNFSSAIWSAAKTLSPLLQRLCTGNPTQICVCWHSNTFPELKLSREFSSSFFEARTMLVCDWLWYLSLSNAQWALDAQHPSFDHDFWTVTVVIWVEGLKLAQIIWVCDIWCARAWTGSDNLNWVVGAKFLQQRRQCFSSISNGWGEICASTHAFLGYLWFWMGNI